MRFRGNLSDNIYETNSKVDAKQLKTEEGLDTLTVQSCKFLNRASKVVVIAEEHFALTDVGAAM